MSASAAALSEDRACVLRTSVAPRRRGPYPPPVATTRVAPTSTRAARCLSRLAALRVRRWRRPRLSRAYPSEQPEERPCSCMPAQNLSKVWELHWYGMADCDFCRETTHRPAPNTGSQASNHGDRLVRRNPQRSDALTRAFLGEAGAEPYPRVTSVHTTQTERESRAAREHRPSSYSSAVRDFRRPRRRAPVVVMASTNGSASVPRQQHGRHRRFGRLPHRRPATSPRIIPRALLQGSPVSRPAIAPATT